MTLTDTRGRTIAAVPATPLALAADDRFRDGSWRAPDGRDLMELLIADLGMPAAHALWNAASDLFEQRAPGARAHLRAVGGAS